MLLPARLWNYRAVIHHLTQRELKLRYKRSVLGWLWSLINPAAILLVYTLVFGTFLRIVPPVAGNGRLQSFAIYLFAGLVVWDFFSAVVTGSMGWLLSSGPLLNKIYFPPEAPVFAGALSVLVQTATEAGILVAVLAIVDNLSISVLFLPIVMALLFFFALGLGLIASLANVYFRDITHIVSIGTTMLFYATPIVYPLQLVPEKVGPGVHIREIIRLNPITQFVGIARDILYHLQIPSLSRLGLLAAVSAFTFVIGLLVFHRYGAHLSEDL
jgi:ABC-type polysaccharide/polyol phosphate export permease